MPIKTEKAIENALQIIKLTKKRTARWHWQREGAHQSEWADDRFKWEFVLRMDRKTMMSHSPHRRWIRVHYVTRELIEWNEKKIFVLHWYPNIFRCKRSARVVHFSFPIIKKNHLSGCVFLFAQSLIVRLESLNDFQNNMIELIFMLSVAGGSPSYYNISNVDASNLKCVTRKEYRTRQWATHKIKRSHIQINKNQFNENIFQRF